MLIRVPRNALWDLAATVFDILRELDYADRCIDYWQAPQRLLAEHNIKWDLGFPMDNE